MFFDDFFGLLGSFKPNFTPDPKNFLFLSFVRAQRGEAKIGLERPKIALRPAYALASSFSTPGMSLNHFLMRFSDSWDDFRWNMHFFEIFCTFMVFEGEMWEMAPWGPKITP